MVPNFMFSSQKIEYHFYVEANIIIIIIIIIKLILLPLCAVISNKNGFLKRAL